jgi:hypothetical protein
LLTPSRCVLIIGDEGLYVYETGFSKTRLIDSVTWGSKDLEETVSDIIRRECKGKPVLIVNDMTDQHFKGGQRIPKVGPLDKANVVARKLNVAFPNYPIRGALPVKDRARGKSLTPALSGGTYLFAAVPMSEPVQRTLSSVRASLAPISGFVLLPIESSDMVRALAEKAMKKDKRKSRWAVLLGQHMGGGLRQVITRDGQLAMTRMTPVADMDTDPQGWVNDVAQEFQATISYLTRFGYNPEDGMEVFVIATPSAGEQLRSQLSVECNFTSYTVTEAASTLGLKIGPQDDQYHADPLQAAWIGQKAKFILPMEAMDVKKIHAPRQAAMVAGLALFLGASYLAWETMSQAQALLMARENLLDQRRIQQNVESQYQSELERMQSLGFDVKLIQNSLRTFAELESSGIHPLPLVQAIGKALGPDLRIDKLTVTTQGPQLSGPSSRPVPGSTPPAGTFIANLVLSFPSSIDPEFSVRQVNDLSRRLSAELPEGYKVEIAKQVANMSYTDNTVGAVGQQTGSAQQRPENYQAELVIRGPLL